MLSVKENLVDKINKCIKLYFEKQFYNNFVIRSKRN